jgi:CheY-like chemotaxis protein
MHSSRILIVEPDSNASAALVSILGNAGHLVTAFKCFESAEKQGWPGPPDLLIAAIRLGRFNGLHLAVRFRAEHPGLPIIVTGDHDEVGLAAEARELEARFVPRSTPPAKLIEFVDHLLAGRSAPDFVSTRRWPRYAAALPAQLADRAGWVVDVSYGGVCVQCTSPPAVNTPVEVMLPTMSLTFNGIVRWCRPSPAGEGFACGVELDRTSSDVRAWRVVIDSVLQSC